MIEEIDDRLSRSPAAEESLAYMREKRGTAVCAPSTSAYVTMSDGVRIALSVWLPAAANEGNAVPTVFVLTRYGRDSVSISGGLLRWLAEGFALVAVDARGTAASFGDRPGELMPLADIDELIAYIVSQPWCDGRLIATGSSYLGSTADLSTAASNPALLGAIVHHSDFDMPQHLMMPGGLLNRYCLETWAAMTLPIDTGKDPDVDPPLDVLERASDLARFAPVITPVAGVLGEVQARSALTTRVRWSPDDLALVEFRDDKYLMSCSLSDWSPSQYNAEMSELGRPVQYWGSWLDGGTAESALARFRSINSPCEVWITGNDHFNQVLTDPFVEVGTPAYPTSEERFQLGVEFARRVLSRDRVDRKILYARLGDRTFGTAKTWPPENIQSRRFYLASNGCLTSAAPAAGRIEQLVGADRMTSPFNRWTANLGAAACYQQSPPPRDVPLAFTTDPFPADIELAGYPFIRLRMATNSADASLAVYLEDVDSHGHLTYLSEGILRCRGRKLAAPGDLPFDAGPAAHTHLRRDEKPYVPGELFEIQLVLMPVAARIAAGHSIRIRFTLPDPSIFCVPDRDREVLTLEIGNDASIIELPLRPWQS